MKPIKIVFDGLPLIGVKTGIGYYTYNLIRALQASNKPIEILINYGLRWSRHLSPDVEPKIITLAKSFKRFIPKGYVLYSYYISLSYIYGNIKHRPDIFHYTNYCATKFNRPTVITVCDLSYLRYPETLPADRLAWLRDYLPESIENSSKILTISEFSKSEILKFFPIPADKVVVTYCGIDSCYRPLDEEEIKKQLQSLDLEPKRYILSVGTIEPRKNLKVVIEAYAQLPARVREYYPLVIVGGRGWKESSIMDIIDPLEKRGQIRVLGYIPQEVLPAIYNGAKVFVFPSIYEGFGMPVTEAMACGTPVIASNVSSLPEVVGDSGLLLDPYDTDVWTRALEEMIDDDEKYNLLKKRGLERASLFSWEKTAEKTFQVYCEVAR